MTRMTQIKITQTPPQFLMPEGINLRNPCHLWESAIQTEKGELAMKHVFQETSVSFTRFLVPALELFVPIRDAGRKESGKKGSTPHWLITFFTRRFASFYVC
jgi:hypothetical protein